MMKHKNKRPDSAEILRTRRLATYNSERMRGLLHSEEWKDYMREEQDWFDKTLREKEDANLSD
jgi:hypothetical protein